MAHTVPTGGEYRVHQGTGLLLSAFSRCTDTSAHAHRCPLLQALIRTKSNFCVFEELILCGSARSGSRLTIIAHLRRLKTQRDTNFVHVKDPFIKFLLYN